MPAVTPVTTPLELPTVARAVFPLVHVPPAVDDESVVVLPMHVCAVPAIAAGTGLTVTSRVLKQPTKV